jgi:membrane associated rhomboid family serine protease
MSHPFHSRSSGHRNWRDATQYYTVTLVLMAASIVVAAMSQIGDQTEKVDALFFSSQRELAEVMYTEEELANWEAIPQAEIKRRNDQIDAILAHPARDLQKGQVWRAVTPIFLHFGIMHIVFNMMWLWDFGRVLETRFRSLRFLALVLFTAVLSNTAQAFISGSNFGGMSGVNYGLFGFLLARSKLHPDPGFVINRQTAAMLLIWLVVCFTGLLGPVANTAHVVGFASGGLVGIINALQGGAWALLKRKQQFRSALRKSDNALHQCSTCHRTEHDDADLEFYVHPTDGKEYCKDHLPM